MDLGEHFWKRGPNIVKGRAGGRWHIDTTYEHSKWKRHEIDIECGKYKPVFDHVSHTQVAWIAW